MAGHRPFSELFEKVPPERQAEVKARVDAELRKVKRREENRKRRRRTNQRTPAKPDNAG